MPRPGRLTGRDFFQRPVQDLAQALLGMRLRHGPVTLAITEVEAYDGPGDSASHARSGRTPRNAPMWEAGGLAYVYFCYGMHHMLNVVAGPEGQAAAVLIRSCEPLAGLPEIRARRGGLDGPVLLTGPGKVAQALGLDLTFSGHPLFLPGGLELLGGVPPAAILAGPRVGVDFATPADRARPWRFAAAGTRWVSQPKGLLPLKDICW